MDEWLTSLNTQKEGLLTWHIKTEIWTNKTSLKKVKENKDVWFIFLFIKYTNLCLAHHVIDDTDQTITYIEISL